jgi:hypothetical protein
MHVYAMSRNLEEIYGKLACRLNFIAREAFLERMAKFCRDLY